MAYDSQNRRMFMTGGWRNDLGGPGTAVDVWALDLTSATPSWTPITPVGTPPVGRAFASLVYDPSDNRLILYGGEDQGSRYPDVWSLSLTGTPTWTQLTPTGTPPAGRSRHGAIYDPVRDQMVIFGGSSLVFPYFGNDVWALSLSGAPAWSQLSPAGTPPSRRQGMAVALDAPRDRMIVFGGHLGHATDLHERCLGPEPRGRHRVGFDRGRSRTDSTRRAHGGTWIPAATVC